MTRVLLIVHGMGVHGTDWAGSAIDVLQAAAASYGLTLERTVTAGGAAVVPVSYDDRFRAHVAKWGNDSREMARFIRRNSIDVPVDLVRWLETADETENNFLWSHVVDVILYRFFNEVTKDVRVHVMRDIVRAWSGALDLDPSAGVSVLAHSLGTSVTHDALGLLATDPPKGAKAFLAGSQRLAHLFMVANVSRILETLPRVYESVVCPPGVRGTQAYCGVFHNIRHELDPFPAPRPFTPVWAQRDDFVQVETKAIREFNVHSLERYLEDPRVHVRVLRALFGRSAIDDATRARRIAEYDAQPGPPCVQALQDFVATCRQRVRLIEDATDVKTLVTAGTGFLADVERTRARCKAG